MPTRSSHFVRRRLLAVPALLAVLGVAAAPAPAPLAGPARAVVESFLLAQTAGLAGKVGIRVDSPAAGPLPACQSLQAFLPQGVSAWGRLSVGLRCAGEQPWTRFVAAQVVVDGSYLVAARPIAAGQAASPGDFVMRTGDLARLPKTVVTDPAQLEGLVATNAIAPGTPLRQDLWRGAVVIQQGQPVRLLAQGDGFVASTEGKAMTRAAVGGTVQVRTAEGRLLSGVATGHGQVKLAQ